MPIGVGFSLLLVWQYALQSGKGFAVELIKLSVSGCRTPVERGELQELYRPRSCDFIFGHGSREAVYRPIGGRVGRLRLKGSPAGSRALPRLLLHPHHNINKYRLFLAFARALRHHGNLAIALLHGRTTIPGISLTAPNSSYSGRCCAPLNSPSRPALRQARLRLPACGS